MVRGSIDPEEYGYEVTNLKSKKDIDMVLKSYKTENIHWDDEWPHFPDDEENEGKTLKKASMKNIFVNPKIKKIKFSKEIAERIKFAPVNKLVEFEDGSEGYLGAYSEIEFLAYRYQRVHKKYPDSLRMSHVDSQKFLVDMFKHISVPPDAFYKSIEDKRGDIMLNSIIFCFESKIENEPLYLYMDTDEAVFFYPKALERDGDSIFNLLIALIKGCVNPKVTKNKIFVVYQAQSGFEKTGFDVKKINVDLNKNYNTGFDEVSEEIIKGLNDKKKTNLVILRGAPGTGKTTYIRYLTSKLKKNIIFISPDMVNHITDPSFIPFLIKNSDAVLIIEDGEPAIGKRDINGRTGAVSNILNLTDGLLSDCLNISIVVTLNTDNKDIDPALERKGRLLKHYTFEKLAVDKSKALLKEIGAENVEVTEPMTLADIYFNADETGAGQAERRKIGFN